MLRSISYESIPLGHFIVALSRHRTNNRLFYFSRHKNFNFYECCTIYRCQLLITSRPHSILSTALPQEALRSGFFSSSFCFFFLFIFFFEIIQFNHRKVNKILGDDTEMVIHTVLRVGIQPDRIKRYFKRGD